MRCEPRVEMPNLLAALSAAVEIRLVAYAAAFWRRRCGNEALPVIVNAAPGLGRCGVMRTVVCRHGEP